MMYGPQTPFSQELHATKYREKGETFDDYCVRYARTTADSEKHFRRLLDGLRNQRILPAGRQQFSVGRPYQTTCYNCFVGGVIPDSMEGIMTEARDSAMTLRTGGGCGWDFSTLRPQGDPILGLGQGSYATGPVSFMNVWNAVCGTVLTAGHRRGAMMGVLRIDHPDVMTFINAKQDQATLANFNISLAVTNDFMEALSSDGLYTLKFGDRSYRKVRAADVWARIMERNWDWAEPGVLFIDRINEMNPLSYCERIIATNPCGEQPLPPYGACLLGSVNLVKYLSPAYGTLHSIGSNALNIPSMDIDYNLLRQDIAAMVRAFDNVIDSTVYPLPQQQAEAQKKRRMGIGVTGMANALEIRGFAYGSDEYLRVQDSILEEIRNAAYRASIELAIEKGPFELFDEEGWLASGFAKTLPEDIIQGIRNHGLRNGLLTSIAPTGTISLCADNVSSGIEPPYKLETKRLVHMPRGQVEVPVRDYAFENFKVKGKTAEEVDAKTHVRVLCHAQKYIDSAVSKTVNVKGQKGGKGPGMTYEEFQDLYTMAWEGGAKGCTTFNANGKRFGIFLSDAPSADEGAACFIDPATGDRTCEG